MGEGRIMIWARRIRKRKEGGPDIGKQKGSAIPSTTSQKNRAKVSRQDPYPIPLGSRVDKYMG